MLDTPRSVRLHVAIFGKRNAGKSSLINAITNQELAVVSPVSGTTTDPVFKSMEISPIGPITLIDTAGIDDQGELGELRVKKTMQVLAKTDLVLLVIAADIQPDKWEESILEEAQKRCIPIVGVISKVDVSSGDMATQWFTNKNLPYCKVDSTAKAGIDKLKDLIVENYPQDYMPSTIIGDLINEKDTIILVTPVDAGAPKSRMILPQVQVLRDALDAGACVMVVREHELQAALDNLKNAPSLVITDSQVFNFVSNIVPENVPLTSFSILFARYKGDLREYLNGIKAIDTLKAGDKVLIAEACTHYPSHEDIGRVKIPNWLNKRVGGKLDFSWVVGNDFPENLPEYKLVVHCGACMINRAEVLERLDKCKKLNIPVVNYGILIGYMTDILSRVIKPLEK